jgi:virginiamycin B lyase
MNRRRFLTSTASAILLTPGLARKTFAQESPLRAKYFPIAAGIGLHDVAPAADGTIWFTCQGRGALGMLNPRDGSFKTIDLGKGAAPHGVTIGPDGAPWITEGGQNAIARVDPADHKVALFPLPKQHAYANLNTGVFDKAGTYWFTGQSGIYGRLEPKSGGMTVFKAPKGVGPYGITATPKGDVWYASLAGNYIAKIDPSTGNATIVQPPTPDQGARRVWSDSRSRIWVSEWNSGNVSVHDPANGSWKTWKLPGHRICERQAPRQCQAAKRAARRGLGLRIRQRPAGRDPGSRACLGVLARLVAHNISVLDGVANASPPPATDAGPCPSLIDTGG